MLIETLCEHLRLARAVNQTSSSFVAKIDTLTPPLDFNGAGNSAVTGVAFRLRNSGVVAQNLVQIVPVGIGNDATTFSMRVYSWKSILQTDFNTANPRQYVPILLADFLCTLTDGETGVAGGIVTATYKYCDTITLTYPLVQPSSIEICSNANNLKAHIVMDMKSADFLELTFSTGSSATSCNALLCMY